MNFETIERGAGLLLVDKPVGASSANVVTVVRGVTGVKRVGHGGTLDPFADGLLPIMVGREFTRQADVLLEGDKEYVMTVRFGSATDTGDCTGIVVTQADSAIVSAVAIERVLDRFRGEIDQVPPVYSALKHEGKPLYWYARRGEDVIKPARRVRIDTLELIDIVGPDATFRVRCSKGTYMRVLGPDIAIELGTSGHLIALRRTTVGPYRVEDAWPLWRLRRMGKSGSF